MTSTRQRDVSTYLRSRSTQGHDPKAMEAGSRSPQSEFERLDHGSRLDTSSGRPTRIGSEPGEPTEPKPINARCPRNGRGLIRALIIEQCKVGTIPKPAHRPALPRKNGDQRWENCKTRWQSLPGARAGWARRRRESLPPRAPKS